MSPKTLHSWPPLISRRGPISVSATSRGGKEKRKEEKRSWKEGLQGKLCQRVGGTLLGMRQGILTLDSAQSIQISNSLTRSPGVQLLLLWLLCVYTAPVLCEHTCLCVMQKAVCTEDGGREGKSCVARFPSCSPCSFCRLQTFTVLVTLRWAHTFLTSCSSCLTQPP